MAERKKEYDLHTEIKRVKDEIRKKVENDLLQEYEAAQTEGRYPWKGMWLKPKEIESLQKLMKRRDRIVFSEVILLFFVLAFIAYLIYKVLLFFLPK
ncbi:MAG TPA: hypothetical protein VFF47_02410 [Nitrospirota bacterium]|nr:hypothetical protein [Nitrospirota bacterium]